MFLIDTDLLHDYFGLNAYKNNKEEREGGIRLWNGSVLFSFNVLETGPLGLSVDCFCRAPKFCQ